MSENSKPDLHALLETAFRETLARFRDEVAKGERDPSEESFTYRKRRRDYATWLRMDRVSPEAQSLARQLLDAQHVTLSDEALAEFERDTTRMLIRLYDAFFHDADQGNR